MQKLHPRAVWILWGRYFWSWFWFYIFWGWIGLIIILSFKSSHRKPTLLEGVYDPFSFVSSVIFWNVIIIIILAILTFFWSKLAYNFFSYRLTDRGVEIKRGVIWQHQYTIPYERIQNIDIHRGIFARLLNLSVIGIQTAGAAAAYGRYPVRRYEGSLPGLAKDEAERLKEDLVKKIKGNTQGL